MIRTAQSHILPVHPHFTTAGLDIQHIPFSEASFDVIIGNHMLYHVPDHPKVFGGIRRLLKPGGRFYASTNGQTHQQNDGGWKLDGGPQPFVLAYSTGLTILGR